MKNALLTIAGIVFSACAANSRTAATISPAEGQRVLAAEVSSAKAKEALMRLENEWLNDENNAEVLQAILADDFVHVLPVGFVSKDEQIAYVRAHPAPNDRKRFEDLRVRVYGTAGIVNGIVVATDKSGGIHRTMFTDVFVDRNGTWLAVNAQELPLGTAPHQ